MALASEDRPDLPAFLQPPRVRLPVDLRFPAECQRAARREPYRDFILGEIAREPGELRGLLAQLRKRGPLCWTHAPGLTTVTDPAGRYWIKIGQYQVSRAVIGKGGKIRIKRERFPRILSNLGYTPK